MDDVKRRSVDGVPMEVLESPLFIREGETLIHGHPCRDEIIQVIALYARERPSKRIPLPAFEKALVATYDTDEAPLRLSGDGKYIATFIKRFIAPTLSIEKAEIASGLLESAVDLNIPLQKMEIAARLKRRFDKTVRDEEATASDVASLGKAAIDAFNKAEESLERFRVYPGKVEKSQHTEVKFDVARVMGTLKGRSRPTVVDAEVVDDSESSSGE